ncbi:MAG: metallophosphoesterase, partial [Ruminococcus sp.]|nr:metallophosphoesterase [Candidatus Copronaster equi]
HYNEPSPELTKTNDDPIFWYANRRCSMDDESGFILDEFLNQCAQNDKIEYVLISGDLADDGKTRPQDHRAVAQKLRNFEAATGKPVYLINGNHDDGLDCETTPEVFQEIYRDFGFDEALTRRENDCSYTVNLGEKYRLIALDSTDPGKSTEDGMSTDKINWVLNQAKQAKKDGRNPILMMHHNILDHMPLQRIISRNFIVRFHYSTAELFADAGIKVVLTGHEHCSDVASFTSALGNEIYDFATTALTMYPLQYRLFSFSDDEISYEAKTIDSIDFDALTSAVDGYTPEMVNLMKAGLNAYAKDFLKVGVIYRLKLQFAKTDVPRDKFYGKVVMKAINRLDEILDLPLTGDNSLQALAAEYNIEIPDSSYKSGWDVVGEVMASHYEGNENYDLDSPLVSTVLKTIVLVLRNDIATVSDEMLLGFANDFLAQNNMKPLADEITKLCVNVFGTYTHIEFFFMSILAPFVYSFTTDDGVDDNNGTMSGYGTVNVENNLNNISANIKAITEKLTLIVNLFMRYFVRATDFFTPIK